ncbi:MAG: deoxyribonuclease-4 [Alteromonas naphthalenivorans]|jgi:deoxyribonuclease-4
MLSFGLYREAGNMARNIGLHLRLTDSLSKLLDRAIELKQSVVQCFFIVQGINKYITFTEGELEECLKKRKKHFKELYLHASYWVNLSGRKNSGWRTFKKELELARTLGFTHIVIHPGSSTGCKDKQEGITCLANALNKALSRYDDITIVIENIAHGKMSVGGDLEDFKELLEQIDEPDRIAFCIDTAHAYSYGYDIADKKELAKFFDKVDDCVGAKRVALLHLNDSVKKCGSRIDKHAIPGQGLIGKEPLEAIMNHPKLKHASIILELPVLPKDEEVAILKEVRSWNKK